jgi:hypothetical protein
VPTFLDLFEDRFHNRLPHLVNGSPCLPLEFLSHFLEKVIVIRNRGGGRGTKFLPSCGHVYVGAFNPLAGELSLTPMPGIGALRYREGPVFLVT